MGKTHVCPIVDCVWGNWTDWTDCSVTCGGGKQNRTRVITTTAENGGNNCTGSAHETQDCNPNACGRKRRSLGIMEELFDLPTYKDV